MALKGDLASVDLAQVFQMLALNQKEGLLYIQSPNDWKALYFDQRGVTLYYNEHVMLDRVLTRLVNSGVLAADGVQETREHAARQGKTTFDSLLAGGYMTEDELRDGFRSEIEEEVYDLFFWYNAKFEFFEGAKEHDGKEGTIHDDFFFGTDMLIMEAARRIDEWTYITEQIPNGQMILRPVENGAVPDVDDDEMCFLDLVDGSRNVDRLIEVTGTTSFYAFKVLASLLDRGYVENVPIENLTESGRLCMNEGRMRDAINLFESAVTESVDIPEVHSLASEAYDAIGEYELSAYHTQCIAEHHAANGNLKEAISVFRAVLETIPTDLGVCQRVVELSVGHPELATADFDPLAVGKDLVDLYLEIDEVDQVRALLEEMIREHPGDIELKKSLINVHTKVGDTTRVIELYQSIADDLTKAGDPIQAIKYLQKILQVDRSRTDISEWIKRLYQADERRRTRRRSLFALGVVFCLLVVASIGFFLYNQNAREEFAALDVESMLEEKDFDGAIRRVEVFIEEHPFTTVRAEAKPQLEELKARRKAHEAKERRAEDQRQAELQRYRYQYENLLKQFRKNFDHEKLDLALQDLKSIRGLVKQAGQARDKRWSKEHGIEDSHAQLTKYLGEAASLEREKRAAIDTGDWQEARKLVLVLLADFPMASEARIARIPVRIESQPAGAQVFRDGKPMLDDDDRPLITPAVVLYPNEAEVRVELRKKDFEVLALTINPRVVSRSSRTLTIKPTQRLGWAGLIAQSAVGVNADGTVAVGLSGGYLGLTKGKDGAATKIKLPGLSEVNSTPVVTQSHVFFATNNDKLVAYDRRTSKLLWKYEIKTPLVYDPVIANSRVYLVDRSGTIICLSARNRSQLWSAKLSGRASGEPVVFGRNVAVASSGGSVRVLDSSNKGKPTTALDLERGVTTPVLINRGFIVFGTGDGKLHAYRRGTTKPVWTKDVGRAIREREICMSKDGGVLYLVGEENKLLRISVLDGRILGEMPIKHRIRPGIVTTEKAVFVVVRERMNTGLKEKAIHNDLLLALDPTTLETQWRFSDGGDFRGRLVVNGERLYLTGSKGEVYRLQW